MKGSVVSTGYLIELKIITVVIVRNLSTLGISELLILSHFHYFTF